MNQTTCNVPAVYLSIDGSGSEVIAASPQVDTRDTDALQRWVGRLTDPSRDDFFPFGCCPLPSRSVAVCTLIRHDAKWEMRACIASRSVLDAFDAQPFWLAVSLPPFDVASGRPTEIQLPNHEIPPPVDATLIERAGVAIGYATTASPVALLAGDQARELLLTLGALLPREARRSICFAGWPVAETPEPHFLVLQGSTSLKLPACKSYLDLSEPFKSLPQLQPSYGLAIVREWATAGVTGVTRFVSQTPDRTTWQQLDDLSRTVSQDPGWFQQVIVSEAPTTSSCLAIGDMVPLHQEHVMERLDRLDEAVFNAFHGDTQAMTHLKEVWPQLRQEITPNLFEESRRQYARQFIGLWEQQLTAEETFDAHHAISLLRILVD